MNSNTPARDMEATGRPVALWESLPVFFRQAAEPIRRWLQNPDVIEICCNKPGEVWIEALNKTDDGAIFCSRARRRRREADRRARRRGDASVRQFDDAAALGRHAARRAVPGGVVASRAGWRRLLDPQTGRRRSLSRRLSRVQGVRQCEGARGARRAYGGRMARTRNWKWRGCCAIIPRKDCATRLPTRSRTTSPWLSPGEPRREKRRF